jgi:hypothetical protein
MNNEVLLCYGYLEKKNLKKFKEVMKNKKIAISYRCDWSKDIWGVIIKRLTIVLSENGKVNIKSLKERIAYILTKDIDIYNDVYGKDFWYEIKIKAI